MFSEWIIFSLVFTNPSWMQDILAADDTLDHQRITEIKATFVPALLIYCNGTMKLLPLTA